ncbi:hypothetical protein D3C79_864460 [compost metagenome]
MQAVAGFVADWIFGRLLLHLRSEAATLNHETRDHPVENGVGVEAAIHVFQEILAADRRLDRVQFHFDLAEAGVEQYVGRLLGSHQAGGEDDRASGEQEFFQHGLNVP